MSAQSRLIAECTFCQWQNPSLGPADFSKGVASMPTGGATGPGWSGKQMVVVDLNHAAKPMPVAQSQTYQTPTAALPNGYTPYASLPPGPAPTVPSMAPGDVLSWIEQRAMWLAAEEARIEGEIASQKSRLAGVKAEQKRLMRMMRAGRRDEAREEIVRAPPLQTTLDAVEH